MRIADSAQYYDDEDVDDSCSDISSCDDTPFQLEDRRSNSDRAAIRAAFNHDDDELDVDSLALSEVSLLRSRAATRALLAGALMQDTENHRNAANTTDNAIVGVKKEEEEEEEEEVEITAPTAHKLKFDIVTNDGGEYGPLYSQSHLLVNDLSVYCSVKQKDVNILMEHRPDIYSANACFTLTSFIIKAPATGYTAPCKDGLIFVSHSPIDLESSKHFDGMTRKSYKEFARSARKGRLSAEESKLPKPVAFFRLTNASNYALHQRFSKPQHGRYVLVKLLNSDWHGPDDYANIDLQYISFKGHDGKRCIGYGNLA